MFTDHFNPLECFLLFRNDKGSFISYANKIFQKTSISYRLILRTRTSTYQRIRNIGFLENFVYILNEWPLIHIHVVWTLFNYHSHHVSLLWASSFHPAFMIQFLCISGIFKASVCYFLSNFHFLTKRQPLENCEKCVLLHLKISFRSRDFCNFSTLSRFKRTNGSGLIYGLMDCLA